MTVEELVVAHSGWIRKKARTYYANVFDADDLASETIFKCLKQARRFDTDKSFKPWALAIMANTYITQYNRRKCVMFTGYDEVSSHICTERCDQRASVSVLLSIIRKCARESLCIESVILYAKGYSYEEIAAIAAIPVGTVKSRVAAGRRMLRLAME